MASLRKRPSSSFWYACITLPSGKQKQFSTGLTDRAEAMDVAVSAERAFVRANSAPSTLHARLARIAEDVAPEQTVRPSTWLRAWAKSRTREISPKTASSYTSNIEAVAGALDAADCKSFTALTAPLITRIRDQQAETFAPTTINLRLDILRVALNSAVRENLLASNPALSVKKLPAKQSTRREFRPAELEILLSHVTGEWRTLVLLGLYTAQRLNDLASLQWRHLDLAEGTIRFRASKTGALVALPLAAPLLEALTALPTSDDINSPVLPSIAAMGLSTRSNAFMAILHDCGITTRAKRTQADPLRRMSPLSFHSLRHTATTMLKAAGISDSIARAIVGHESRAISDHYTHLDMATLRDAMDKLTTHASK